MSTTPGTAAAPPDEPKKPRTLWEKVTTSTPVMLTVVATVLAGLSSSEMTRAQYYRSLAAQNQSKVSDEWNLFQAKRVRGTSMEMTIGLLRALGPAGEVSAAGFRAAAERLPADFARADEEAQRLAAAAEAAKGDLGPGGGQLARAVADLRKSTAALKGEASKAKQKADKMLGDEKVGKSFAYIGTRDLPAREDRTPVSAGEIDEALKKAFDEALPDARPEERDEMRASLRFVQPELMQKLLAVNPTIPVAVAQVMARRTERQMAPTLKGITEDQIHDAIEAAAGEAAQFDKVGKPVGDSYRKLDGLVAGKGSLTAPVRAYHKAAREVAVAASALPSGDAKSLNDVRLAAAAVARTDADLTAAADELANGFKAAQIDYNNRRYEREARYNQAVAGLYELDVRKASLESDRHVNRSKNFFYAMLAAQAGVTIATFSLAVRYRSTLWALASAAGLAALCVAGYVYLKM